MWAATTRTRNGRQGACRDVDDGDDDDGDADDADADEDGDDDDADADDGDNTEYAGSMHVCTGMPLD